MDELLKTISFIPPYRIIEAKRKTTLRFFRWIKGVYLIKEFDQIVYVGMSGSCVYKALYRHFERWSDSRIERQTYLSNLDNYSIAGIASDNYSQLEKDLIRFLRPRDNREYYDYEDSKPDPLQFEYEEAPF